MQSISIRFVTPRCWYTHWQRWLRLFRPPTAQLMRWNHEYAVYRTGRILSIIYVHNAIQRGEM